MQHGYQCGMIWGSSLAAGSEAYRKYGPGAKAQSAAILTAKNLAERFKKDKNTINCLEITDIDNESSNLKMFVYFVVKGGTIGCIKMASSFAPKAFNEIVENFETDFSEYEKLEAPVSCAALLAEKMGQSEEHQTRLAGLAGGIGLCGGACGALGAFIWMLGKDDAEKNNGKVEYKDPKSLDAIDRFLKVTDYKFECEDIVGKKFESVEEHSEFIKNKGCAEIIELLASLR